MLEGVLPEGNVCVLDFEDCMKVKICVSFEKKFITFCMYASSSTSPMFLVGRLLLSARNIPMQQLSVTVMHLGTKSSFTV
jgi:hypothetical protein